MASSASQAVTVAQQAAGRIVTDATEWVIEQLRTAGAEIAATLVQETQAEVAKAEAMRSVAVRAAWIASGAAIASFCGHNRNFSTHGMSNAPPQTLNILAS